MTTDQLRNDLWEKIMLLPVNAKFRRVALANLERMNRREIEEARKALRQAGKSLLAFTEVLTESRGAGKKEKK